MVAHRKNKRMSDDIAHITSVTSIVNYKGVCVNVVYRLSLGIVNASNIHNSDERGMYHNVAHIHPRDAA